MTRAVDSVESPVKDGTPRVNEALVSIVRRFLSSIFRLLSSGEIVNSEEYREYLC